MNNSLLNIIKNTPAGRLKSNLHLFEEKQEKPKRNKFNNVQVEFDGQIFDSKGELARYITLRTRERLGEIKDLQTHLAFELNEGGTHSMKYECDFAYIEVKTGEYVVEDFKGKRTKLFEKKERLMKSIHNITIKIVK